MPNEPSTPKRADTNTVDPGPMDPEMLEVMRHACRPSLPHGTRVYVDLVRPLIGDRDHWEAEVRKTDALLIQALTKAAAEGLARRDLLADRDHWEAEASRLRGQVDRLTEQGKQDAAIIDGLCGDLDRAAGTLVRRKIDAAEIALCWHGHGTLRAIPAEIRLRFWQAVAALTQGKAGPS